MKRTLAVACVVLFVFAGLIFAQAPPQMPKAGPEQKRLGYFVGKWTTQGDAKESPFGPAGKFTSTDRNEWFPGGFFVVLHSNGKSPMGAVNELAVMGYNAEEKVYTYDGFDNFGFHETSKGTVQGDTWTWTSETKMGGKLMKNRFTIKELSSTSYSFKFETSTDGGAWSTIVEGKSTKTK